MIVIMIIIDGLTKRFFNTAVAKEQMFLLRSLKNRLFLTANERTSVRASERSEWGSERKRGASRRTSGASERANEGVAQCSCPDSVMAQWVEMVWNWRVQFSFPWTNKRAKRAVWSKKMNERCVRTYEWRSEWPSTQRIDSIIILPNVDREDWSGHLTLFYVRRKCF